MQVLDADVGCGDYCGISLGMMVGVLSFRVGFLWNFFSISLKGHKPVLLPAPRMGRELRCKRKPGCWGRTEVTQVPRRGE